MHMCNKHGISRDSHLVIVVEVTICKPTSSGGNENSTSLGFSYKGSHL
jgi:hypothetical protein